MSHDEWIQLFAFITLVGAGFVILVDLVAEFEVEIALRVWGSIPYHVVRYLTGGSAIVLALDVLTH